MSSTSDCNALSHSLSVYCGLDYVTLELSAPLAYLDVVARGAPLATATLMIAQ
jgi:hypothetical protein